MNLTKWNKRIWLISVYFHLEWISASYCGVWGSMRGWSRTQGSSRGRQSCSPGGLSYTNCRGSACVGGSGTKECTHSQQQGSGSGNCCLPPTPPGGSGARPSRPPEAGGSPCHLCLETSIRLWRWWRRRWSQGCRGMLGCVSASWGCSRWRPGCCRVSSESGWPARPAAAGC